jgi:hypothetical protein
MKMKGTEIKAFHAVWWTLAVLLPDLAGLAMRDWRGVVAGACVSALMIALSLRLASRQAADAAV